MDVSVAGPEKVSRVARLVALQGGARGFEPKPATALPNGILWLVQSEPCKTHPRVVCHDNLAKRRQLLIHPTVMTTPVGMPHRYRLNRAIASVVIVLVALSTLQRLLRDFDQGGYSLAPGRLVDQQRVRAGATKRVRRFRHLVERSAWVQSGCFCLVVASGSVRACPDDPVDRLAPRALVGPVGPDRSKPSLSVVLVQ